jgi:hypothetical protein
MGVVNLPFVNKVQAFSNIQLVLNPGHSLKSLMKNTDHDSASTLQNFILLEFKLVKHVLYLLTYDDSVTF